MKNASEMTYTVSSGALNSTQTKPSVASAQGLKLEARSAESGDGELGLGSSLSSSSGVPQPPSVLLLSVFSDDLFCYRKLSVYCASFTVFVILCGSTRGPQELGTHRFNKPPEPPVSTPLGKTRYNALS